ncbi:WD repeat-containing protein 76 [Neosynchiropus ocellatus]
MATRRSERAAALKAKSFLEVKDEGAASQRTTEASACQEETPEQRAERRHRRTLAPKRLNYSPGQDSETAGPQRKRVKKEDPNQREEKPVKKEKLPQVAPRVLSEYELERLENIRQNQNFLSSINLFQVSDEFRQSTKPKPSQRGLMRSSAAVLPVLPPRKSLRLQKKEAEVLELPPEPTSATTKEQVGAEGSRGSRCLVSHVALLSKTFSEKKPPGPLPMDAINMEEGSKLPSELLDLCSEKVAEQRKQELDLKSYCSALKAMKISEERVAKVVTDRIFSVAVHQSCSRPLVAAGDKWGRVGLWNVEADWGDDGVLLFHPHSRPVPCMAFSRANPGHLLSLSYDGSLRCMDLHKAAFDDVYNIDDGLKTFDFLSHDCSTLLVGTWYGDVSIVDRRTPGNSHESVHVLDPKALRCVNVHPVQKQYFVVAESRTVSVYDCRSLKKKSQPVSQLAGHTRSISSCFFSPHTGHRVVTTCMDDAIRIFDTSSLTTGAPLLKSIRHDMHTGRWLSKLSAVWDPKREDCFVIGSMLRPRCVRVFHESGQLQHSFTDGNHLTTVLSVCAFHPHRNVLVGGNASGRVHVFSD